MLTTRTAASDGGESRRDAEPCARMVSALRRCGQEAAAWPRSFALMAFTTRMAFFADPDGNPLTLHGRYAPRD